MRGASRRAGWGEMPETPPRERPRCRDTASPGRGGRAERKALTVGQEDRGLRGRPPRSEKGPFHALRSAAAKLLPRGVGPGPECPRVSLSLCIES